jgi:hypothetical protein
VVVPPDSVSPEIAFTVETGTVGLVLRAAARDTTSLELFPELLGPSGELLSCAHCDSLPVVGEATAGRGTTQMPSTDRPGWELQPGEYSFRVRSTSPRHLDPPPVLVDVTATFRSDAGLTVEHRLNLNFIYLPGLALTAATASVSAELDTVLERTDLLLRAAGIRLGEVTHTDLDRPEFTNIGDWTEAGRMFRSSVGLGRPRALNVFWVGHFEGILQYAAGISGGIPGAALNGTTESGIAIREAATWPCCLPVYAAFFGHEIGHYLGLYHTSEADLEDWDPLSDTPPCTEGMLWDCPDYTNVMFPLINETHTNWSPAQVGILGTHPTVRTVVVPGPRALKKEGAEGVAGIARPNPFRETVRIHGVGAEGGQIVDVAGRRVARLSATGGDAVWNGHDGSGRRVPAGVYFFKGRTADGEVRTVRLIRTD